MKIVTIIGARPQFIKTATVSRAISTYNSQEQDISKHIQEIIVHTGQHYDENMSQVFFDELEIPVPDYNLEIGSGSHGQQTGKMLEAIEKVLVKEKPNWVLVYGDTNSTLAGALAAAKVHVPVAHVEAGLRSFNRQMPEEINRVLTDHLSTILFAPTKAAVTNLINEGIDKVTIYRVGDVMYDAALFYAAKAIEKSVILKKLNLLPGEYILATVHRAENTDNLDTIQNIFEGLFNIADKIPVVIPLHPRTRNILNEIDSFQHLRERITFIDPVGYLDMVMLEKNAKAIITDSGGVQKEAYFYQVPCITLRTETEWVELVETGVNCLIPPQHWIEASRTVNNIIDNINNDHTGLYGSGQAAEIILWHNWAEAGLN